MRLGVSTAWRLAVAALTLSACGPRPGSGTSVSVPRTVADATSAGDWLGGDAQVSKPRVLALFELASRDPSASALIDDAARALAKGSREGLAALFTRCAADVEGSGEAGKTYLRWQTALLSKDHPTLLEGAPSAELTAKIRELSEVPRTLVTRVEDHPDYVVVRRGEVPTICLVAPMSTAAAYEAMIHELVHAQARQATDEAPDADAFATEDAYLTAVVLSPGDEVDAYVVASGARARLDGTNRNLIAALANKFDPAGRLLVGRDEIARVVLARRPWGLGYGDTGLRGAYARDKEMRAKLRASRRAFVEQLLAAKRQELSAMTANLGVRRHNLDARRQNLAIARARGDAAEAARLTKGIADDERALRELGRVTPLVRDGVTRLERELARLR